MSGNRERRAKRRSDIRVSTDSFDQTEETRRSEQLGPERPGGASSLARSAPAERVSENRERRGYQRSDIRVSTNGLDQTEETRSREQVTPERH